MLGLLRKALGKPSSVVAYRAAQEARLLMLGATNGWRRLERRVWRFWDADRVRAMSSPNRPFTLLAADGGLAFRDVLQGDPQLRAAILAQAYAIRDRCFTLLGAPVPTAGAWPWHTDWRYGYTWEPIFFKRYDFYQARATPYDVKFPWELSRLGYLIPMLQCLAVEPAAEWSEKSYEILLDWERQNPLAYSANWYAMESSIRSLNLLFAFELLRTVGEPHQQIGQAFLRQLTMNGEFIWSNIEYTDIRGNHFIANIVALLLLGLLLGDVYTPAKAWANYARGMLEAEAELQLLQDGVFFDRSVAYHRLVTELFVAALVGLRRIENRVSTSLWERVQAACLYLVACRRPDELASNVGDNDDARILQFDPVPLRDHSPLLGVAAAFFEDSTLKTAASKLPVAVPWLLGREGVARWKALKSQPLPHLSYFSEGGVVVCRHAENYLWMDVGEFGKKGSGGHGHNDLMSFEVSLSGVPLVVDPGCPVYSGDPQTRNLFRSTAYHNGLKVDGCEIVEMRGLFAIGSEIKPSLITAQELDDGVEISVAHRNYSRLPDPVVHTRRMLFHSRTGELRCEDSLLCAADHHIERFLHFDANVIVSLRSHQAEVHAGSFIFLVTWDEGTSVRIDEGWISPGYGVCVPAPILTFTDVIPGSKILTFVIAPVKAF